MNGRNKKWNKHWKEEKPEERRGRIDIKMKERQMKKEPNN
jgi:hypothetical protein